LSGLLRGGRERRQFANVAPVVLDDDDCFQIRCDLLEAVVRRMCNILRSAI